MFKFFYIIPLLLLVACFDSTVSEDTADETSQEYQVDFSISLLMSAISYGNGGMGIYVDSVDYLGMTPVSSDIGTKNFVDGRKATFYFAEKNFQGDAIIRPVNNAKVVLLAPHELLSEEIFEEIKESNIIDDFKDNVFKTSDGTIAYTNGISPKDSSGENLVVEQGIEFLVFSENSMIFRVVVDSMEDDGHIGIEIYVAIKNKNGSYIY